MSRSHGQGVLIRAEVGPAHKPESAGDAGRPLRPSRPGAHSTLGSHDDPASSRSAARQPIRLRPHLAYKVCSAQDSACSQSCLPPGLWTVFQDFP